MNSDERGVQVHGKVSTFSTFWSWNLRTSRTTEEAKKSCLATSKNSWKSFEEFEKKNCCQMNSDERGVQVHGKVSTFSRFWSWNLRTSRTTEEARKSCLATSKNSWKSFEEFEKKLLSDNFSWKSRQKFWSWNLRTSRTTEEAKKSRQTTSSNSSKSIEELEKKNLFREMREQRLLIEAKKSCQPTLTEFFEIHRRTRKTRFVHEAKPLVWTFNSFLFRFSVFSVVSEVVLAIFQSFIFSWVHDFTQTLLGKVNKRSSGDKLKAARLKDLKIEWFLAVLWKVKYQQTY